jgi:hypothetical protein
MMRLQYIVAKSRSESVEFVVAHQALLACITNRFVDPAMANWSG